MTPLLGTKTSSTPVGAKSGKDRRAARSLLSCALWRGMGRLWRGMGGMGRPEPLSAHRPHQQHDHSGFHETRDPRPGYCQARGVSQREFRGFHETRNTRHESRNFCRPVTASLFTIVHHCLRLFTIVHDCSPLFTIVHHCSRLFGIVQQKNITPEPALLSVHTGNAAFMVLLETRITNHGFYAFHESRPLLWRGMGRLWRGMGGILHPSRCPAPFAASPATANAK